MIYKEFGDKNAPTVMLLHGGGLSWWSCRDAAELLKEQFHVVIPILDGHAGSDRHFTSIEDNAAELISAIDEKFGGKVKAIGGLSLGGQILLEMLSQRKDICETAFVESAAVIPSKMMAAMLKPSVQASYGLIKMPWFSRAQFKSLKIKDELYEDYYRDTCKISKEDMAAFLTANQSYALKDDVKHTSAKVYVFAGTKEIGQIKRSAELIHKRIPNSVLEMSDGLYHGQFSINNGEEYAKRMIGCIKAKEEQNALDKDKTQAGK